MIGIKMVKILLILVTLDTYFLISNEKICCLGTEVSLEFLGNRFFYWVLDMFQKIIREKCLNLFGIHCTLYI